MTEDKRKGWLADLKAGSLVAIAARYGVGVASVVKLTRITPSGRIVAGGVEFNADGWERTTTPFSRRHLVEPTPGVVSEFRRRQITNKICSLVDQNRSLLEVASLDALNAVILALENALPKEGRR